MSTNDIKTKIYEYQLIWRLTRDILLFFGGLAGVAYETILASSVNQSLLLIYGGMMGLPAFFHLDNIVNGGSNEPAAGEKDKERENDKPDGQND